MRLQAEFSDPCARFKLVTRLETRPFSDDFLEEAAALLAARQRAHRAAEPLLPSRCEDVSAAALEIKALAAAKASGAVTLRGGRLTGYLLGTSRAEASWGANVWVEVAGHAAAEPEDLRDLYGAAAAEWVERGLLDHYVLVPACDRAAVDAWFRVGFGQQAALGIQRVPRVDWPQGVRIAEPRDLDAIVELVPMLPAHMSRSPTFAQGGKPADAAKLRADILEELRQRDRADLIAERAGDVVGVFVVGPAEISSVHCGLARPEGAALLGWAATRPEVRGTGAGVALTQAAFAWAREHGHEVMVTDWRVTNLLASRFWPRRGFRETFLRLHRRIAA
jgi:GNAT superfamily N-acetyltransferase